MRQERSPLQGSAGSSGSGSDAGPSMGGPLDLNKALSGLPGRSEIQFENLPNIAKKTAAAQGALRAE